jgi:hypothetical protein
MHIRQRGAGAAGRGGELVEEGKRLYLKVLEKIGVSMSSEGGE